MMTQSRRIIEETAPYLIQSPAIPVVVARGKGCVVEDVDGFTYIDCNAGPGVLAAGHSHPALVAAIRDQAEILTQSSGMCYTEALGNLARKLASLSPDGLCRSFFCNSGAEANEGAIKLAKRYGVKNGRSAHVIVALEHAFHGRLALTTALSGASFGRRGLGTYGLFPGVIHIAAPYCYRCPYDLSYPACGVRCAEALEEAIVDFAPGEVGIFLMEPIIGTGGIIVPPQEYFARVEQICREHGVLFIADEVFSGVGRTGKFFAFDHFGVSPDIVTVAKALGGGLPLAAFIARDEIGQSFDSGDHYTTFGWNNAFTMTVALRGLEVLEKEGLVKNAAKMGKRLLTGLRDIAEQSHIVGDVRGRGLFVGLEIVRDKSTKEPGPDLARRLWDHMRQSERVLAGLIGSYKSVIRLSPPLSIQTDEVDEILLRFARSLHVVEASEYVTR